MNLLIRIALYCSIIAGPLSANAQQTRSIAYKPWQTHMHGQHITIPIAPAAKTTAGTDTRLIAETSYDPDGSGYVLTDSFSYIYSGTHGQYLIDPYFTEIYWTFLFDTLKHYNYTPGVTGNELCYQDIDSHNNITGIKRRELDGSADINSTNELLTYDATDHLLKDSIMDGGGPWHNWIVEKRSYNGLGQLDTLIYDNWNTDTLQNRIRTAFHYDAAGNMDTSVAKRFDQPTGTWVNQVMTSAAYDGARNRIESFNILWNAAPGTWYVNEHTVFSSFVNHQPATVIHQALHADGTMHYNTKENTTFTADGKPLYYADQIWDDAASTWVPFDSGRFYYETYSTTPTSLPEYTDIVGDVWVYPMPVSDALHINVDLKDAKTLSFAITDMQGRITMSWTATGQGKYNGSIPVSHLPTGNYILTVESSTGRAVKKISIVK